jgi:hypothetical protein
MGLPGKPGDMSGAEIEKYYRDGRIGDVAEYCEGDVINTYRLWLCHELFRGRLTQAGLEASEASLVDLVRTRGNARSRAPAGPT